MKRSVFHLLAAGSLLLLVAAGVIWVRSYFMSDAWQTENQQRLMNLGHSKGLIRLERLAPRSGFGWRSSGGWYYDPVEPSFRNYDYFQNGRWVTKLRIRLKLATAADPDFELILPHWLFAAIFSVLPAAWLFRSARRRRSPTSENVCARCGYDLRASPHRCPECGTVPPAR